MYEKRASNNEPVTLILNFDYLSTFNYKVHYRNQQDIPARGCTGGRDQPAGSPGLMSKTVFKGGTK